MKKILIAMVVGCFCFGMTVGLSGCYQYIAEHPQKTKKDFYGDQALCDAKARDYAIERRGDVNFGDETNHSRRCMRGLGWDYHFRTSSK